MNELGSGDFKSNKCQSLFCRKMLMDANGATEQSQRDRKRPIPPQHLGKMMHATDTLETRINNSLTRNYNSRPIVKSSLAANNNTLPDLHKEEVALLPRQNGSIKHPESESYASEIASFKQSIEQFRADMKLIKDRTEELNVHMARLEELQKERDMQRVTTLGSKREEKKQPRRKKQRVEKLEYPSDSKAN